MNELGGGRLLTGGRGGKPERNIAYFTILPKAGPADWSSQKGKTKITKKESLLRGKICPNKGKGKGQEDRETRVWTHPLPGKADS